MTTNINPNTDNIQSSEQVAVFHILPKLQIMSNSSSAENLDTFESKTFKDLVTTISKDFYDELFQNLSKYSTKNENGFFELENGIQMSQKYLDGPDCELKLVNGCHYKGKLFKFCLWSVAYRLIP